MTHDGCGCAVSGDLRGPLERDWMGFLRQLTQRSFAQAMSKAWVSLFSDFLTVTAFFLTCHVWLGLRLFNCDFTITIVNIVIVATW